MLKGNRLARITVLTTVNLIGSYLWTCDLRIFAMGMRNVADASVGVASMNTCTLFVEGESVSKQQT